MTKLFDWIGLEQFEEDARKKEYEDYQQKLKVLTNLIKEAKAGDDTALAKIILGIIEELKYYH